MEYVISKQQHGYTVRTHHEFDRGGVPLFWAYSTLQEALDGLKELYTKPVTIGIKD